MFKKIIVINISIILLISNIVVLADDSIDEVSINNIEEVIETAVGTLDIPKINSKYAVILDRNSKSVIYGKNESRKTPMASTTKIMTSLVVIANTNLSNVVEISKKAAGTGGSRLGLKEGDKICVRDLLYGLMLRSGNDAAVALAEYISGSVQEFAKLMNEKAQEINLQNTHFETPHGLDSNNHYTTAYELAILTDYALHNKVFADIVNTKIYTITINGHTKTINNTNELLGNLNGVYGVKTGFTNGAGRCLVTSIKRRNLDVICIVLGADTKKIRTTDSIKLIEYVFKTYEGIDISKKVEEEFNNWVNINKGRIKIEKGVKSNINIKLEEYNLKSYPIKKGEENKIEINITANCRLIAPIKNNEKIGEINVLYNGENIGNINIITDGIINKKGVLDYLLEIGRNYNNYLKETIAF